MKQITKFLGVVAIISVIGLMGCKKSGTESAPAVNANTIESWSIAKMYADNADATNDYAGQTYTVKNIAIWRVDGDVSPMIEAFAYDPASNTVSDADPSMIKGQEIKSAEMGYTFYIDLANKADAAKLVASKNGLILGKKADDFQDVVTIEGIFEKVDFSGAFMKNAKIIAK